MKTYKVAVLGATGAVGREMLAVLEERRFPVGELLPLASKKSAGTRLRFCGEDVPVHEMTENSFSGCDVVLGAAPSEIAKKFAPHIVGAGAVFIDNSSAFRLDNAVPLVVPEINPWDAKAHRGIISNPNCSTIIALVAVNAINALSPIKTMTVSTYQAVSGAGAGGVTELFSQIDAISKNETPPQKIFPRQIAYNLIPQIGEFLDGGYTAEEMKMQNEGRKILHSPSLRVSCTCVRVPVVRSHSEAITVVTEAPVSVDDARAAVACSAGCRLIDDPESSIYPTPLDSTGGDTVLVGRIRKDIALDNALSIWCCGDQLRKGAATNAVQIAELLV